MLGHRSVANKELSFQRRSANCRSKSDADIVDRRDTYLDPLNHNQLELLERYRDANINQSEREAYLAPLLRAINAIASGMRNTG